MRPENFSARWPNSGCREYHIDGYRIDDFADINNWDFVQEFHDRATAMSQSLFPG